jgi:hypothetical protein
LIINNLVCLKMTNTIKKTLINGILNKLAKEKQSIALVIFRTTTLEY